MVNDAGEAPKKHWSDWITVFGAALGIVVVLGGGITGVVTYFATKSELEKVKCISVKNDEMYRHRTKANNSYGEYLAFNADITKLEVKKALQIPIDENELQSFRTKSTDALKRSKDEESKSEAIAASLQSGACDQ